MYEDERGRQEAMTGATAVAQPPEATPWEKEQGGAAQGGVPYEAAQPDEPIMPMQAAPLDAPCGGGTKTSPQEPEAPHPSMGAPASASAPSSSEGEGWAANQTPMTHAASRKPASWLDPHELGREGERVAAEYLERREYEILERNYRCNYGEADIIAKEDDTVILVEVKTRLALGASWDQMPELAVDAEKCQRYRKIALSYMMEHSEISSVRFDVIAINVVGESKAKLRHLVGAFALDN